MRSPRARIPKAFLLFWMAALAAALCWGLLPGQASAQAKEYHMDRYDSTITVNADGSMDIVESLVYVFTSGTFRRGLRTWNLDRLEGIDVTGIAEESASSLVPYALGDFDRDASTSGVTGTYGTEKTNNELRLRWIFGSTSNSSRTFQITYHVTGALRVYDDRDELDWYAVPPGWGSAIDRSQVNVIFPEGVDTSSWDVAAVPSLAQVSKQGNTITWSTNSNLDNGFEIGAHIPKGTLAITKPSWQDSFDRQTSEHLGNVSGITGSGVLGGLSGMQALADLVFFVFTSILLFGGMLWQTIGWIIGGSAGR